MKEAKRLNGLQRICKIHGRLKLGDTMMVWDYANDEAVPESEMRPGSKRWLISEKARFMERYNETEGSVGQQSAEDNRSTP